MLQNPRTITPRTNPRDTNHYKLCSTSNIYKLYSISEWEWGLDIELALPREGRLPAVLLAYSFSLELYLSISRTPFEPCSDSIL